MMGILFDEGAFVWNKDHGLGSVALCSEEEVLVAFENGDEEVYVLEARKRPPLNKLHPDGFWLRRKNDAANFAELIKQQPVQALLAFVRDELDTVTARQLHDAVTPALIPEDLWESWKKEALAALKEDPRFEVFKDDKIAFQGDMVVLAEDLMMEFRKAPSLKEKQKTARKALKLEEKGVPVDDVKEAAISFFTGTAANEVNNMGARLEALFFLKELDPDQHDLLKDSLHAEISNLDLESAADAVAAVSDASIRKSLMDIIKEKKPDRFIEIATQITKRFKKLQRDWVLDYLLDHEDKEPVRTIVDRTMADIATNLQPFVWLCKTTLTQPDKLAITGQSPDSVVPAMFRMFSNIYVTSAFSVRPKDDRSVSREEDELLKLLTNHKQVLSFLKTQPESLVRTFATRYRDCNAIPNDIREDFIDNKFPRAFPKVELEAVVSEEEEVVILTRDTYDKYRKELKDIVEGGLEEATKAISTAREWGDISENAELNIAQENQRKILLRKNQLEHLLDNCRIIDN